MELTIGIDVGGTKIAGGVVDPTGRIVDRLRTATPCGGAEAVEDGIAEVAVALRDRHDAVGVGLAVAGLVDEKRSTMRFAPNLPMTDRPLRESVSARVGLPVVVENDANAAAWGEYRFGGGRGVDDVVLLTVGTGLGGGIVLDGRLLRGAFGGAAELGHVRLVPDGLPCGCGRNGCWEQYTSGSALVREAKALASGDPHRAARLLELSEGSVAAIDGRMVSTAAAEGDPAARELFARLGRWLGEGISLVADVLDPAAVVVGGGVCEAGDLLLEPARQSFAKTLSMAGHRPHLKILAAQLGNDAGILGAADLARQP